MVTIQEAEQQISARRTQLEEAKRRVIATQPRQPTQRELRQPNLRRRGRKLTAMEQRVLLKQRSQEVGKLKEQQLETIKEVEVEQQALETQLAIDKRAFQKQQAELQKIKDFEAGVALGKRGDFLPPRGVEKEFVQGFRSGFAEQAQARIRKKQLEALRETGITIKEFDTSKLENLTLPQLQKLEGVGLLKLETIKEPQKMSMIPIEIKTPTKKGSFLTPIKEFGKKILASQPKEIAKARGQTLQPIAPTPPIIPGVSPFLQVSKLKFKEITQVAKGGAITTSVKFAVGKFRGAATGISKVLKQRGSVGLVETQVKGSLGRPGLIFPLRIPKVTKPQAFVSQETTAFVTKPAKLLKSIFPGVDIVKGAKATATISSGKAIGVSSRGITFEQFRTFGAGIKVDKISTLVSATATTRAAAISKGVSKSIPGETITKFASIGKQLKPTTISKVALTKASVSTKSAIQGAIASIPKPTSPLTTIPSTLSLASGISVRQVPTTIAPKIISPSLVQPKGITGVVKGKLPVTTLSSKDLDTQKIVTTTISVPSPKVIPFIKTGLISKGTTKTKQIPVVTQVPRSIQTPTQIPRIKQVPVQEQITRTTQIPSTKTPAPTIIQRPRITTITPTTTKQQKNIIKKAIQKMKTTGVFDVFVKRKGKDIKIGEDIPTLKKAKKLLTGELKGTLAASGFITEGKGFGKRIPINLGFGFRPAKREPLRVVQKRGFRLGTRSEVIQIKAAKKKKRRQPRKNGSK